VEKAAREEANISLLFLKQIMEAYGPISGKNGQGIENRKKTSTKKITTKSGKENGSCCG
jgi:hypothetical protein